MMPSSATCPAASAYGSQQHCGSQKGFTLLEIIVSITIIGIVLSMIIPLTRTASTNSVLPIIRFQEALEARDTIEEITVQYRSYLVSGQANLLTTLNTWIAANHPAVSRNWVSYDNSGTRTNQSSYAPGRALAITATSGDASLSTVFTE